MKLPAAVYGDGITKGTQVQFKGLNHNLGAKDGELWDMENMTGDFFPLLASREPRRLYRTLPQPGGLFGWDGLAWVDGDGFFYRGEWKGRVSPGKKRFAALGAYIVILPDKAYFNTLDGSFGNLEAEWYGGGLNFINGKLFEEDAEANCLYLEGLDWSKYFKAGDAVTISGCTTHPENNKTPVIREIDGDKLYFYEYTFKLEGADGNTPYTEFGNIHVKRTVPDMDFLCENENRLWGCAGNTIYASKLGDIFNWNVFEGLSTDSYSVETGSPGNFTACTSFLGYPIFFKEDHIYKVYGSRPENFQVMGSATLGVAKGSAGSLAVAGETLFYLSRAGVVAYSGGIPQPIGGAFGTEQFREAAGGSDGLKYYISMRGEDGGFRLYAYDSQRGLWHAEDRTCATHFAQWEGDVFFLNDRGELWAIGDRQALPEAVSEGPVSWWAEFGDFTEESPYKKGVTKIQIRLELDEGASVQVLLQTDSDGIWRKVNGALGEGAKRSYYLPIIPRRADHYRLRLEGVGGCRVYSLSREFYGGSALKSMPGRQ